MCFAYSIRWLSGGRSMTFEIPCAIKKRLCLPFNKDTVSPDSSTSSFTSSWASFFDIHGNPAVTLPNERSVKDLNESSHSGWAKRVSMEWTSFVFLNLHQLLHFVRHSSCSFLVKLNHNPHFNGIALDIYTYLNLTCKSRVFIVIHCNTL